MKTFALVRTSALMVALSATAPALSQNATPSNPSPATLDAVVVSANRSTTPVEDMPLYTTVLTREDIRLSPAQTLDQLLRTVPGMNFTGVPAALSDPTGHQSKMRGLGNAKVLMLVDGVPIHDPFYLTTQWFKVPLSNIERIEVVRGGNSSLWGNMAVAGVVNIVTRRATDDSGELQLNSGNYGTTNFALSRNFKASESLGFNLSVDRYHTDGYQTTPAAYLWRFPSKLPVHATNSNVQLTSWFKPSETLSGFTRLGYHVQDQEISYYSVGGNLQHSPDLSAGLTWQPEKGRSLTTTAWSQYVNFEKFNGASCYWQASGTKCPTSSSVTQPQINSNIAQYYTQYGSQRYREQGASSVWSQDLQGTFNQVQLGADYRRLSATDLEFFYAAPTSLAALQGNLNSSTNGQGVQAFKGLFAQTRLMPLSALELTLSGRFDSWDNTNRINTRTPATGAGAGLTVGGALPDSSKSAFNPSLSGRFELSSELALRGAAYKAFRAPGFNNTTRTYGTGTSTNIANPDLAPESLRGWELGADYRAGDLSLGGTWFVYNIKDMIATYTVSASAASIPAQVTTFCGTVASGGFTNCGAASSVKFYTNDQDGQAHGLELSGRYKASEALSFDATYTHTETYLTRHGSIVTDPVGVQLVATPKNVASLGATWRPTGKLRTFAEARYIGRTLIDTTSTPNVQYGQGGVVIVNASLAYAWDRDLDLTASVVNLFSKEYSENSYTYNQPYNRTLSAPRLVYGGVKLRF